MTIEIKKLFWSIFLEDFLNDELILKNIWILKENLYQTLSFSSFVIIINMCTMLFVNLNSIPVLFMSMVLVSLGSQMFYVSQNLINSINKNININELRDNYLIIQIIISIIFTILITYMTGLVLASNRKLYDRTIICQFIFNSFQSLVHSQRIKYFLLLLVEIMLISQTQINLSQMIGVEGQSALFKHVAQHFINLIILIFLIIRHNVFHKNHKEQLARIYINYKTLHDIRNYLQSFQFFTLPESDDKNNSIDQPNMEKDGKKSKTDHLNYNSNTNYDNIYIYDQHSVNNRKDSVKSNKIINKNSVDQGQDDNFRYNKSNFKFIMQKCNYLQNLDLICELKYKTKLDHIKTSELLNQSTEILNIIFQNKHGGFEIKVYSELESIQIDSNIFNIILTDIFEYLYNIFNQYFTIQIKFKLCDNCFKIIIEIPNNSDVINLVTNEILVKQLDCLGDRIISKQQYNNNLIILEIAVQNDECMNPELICSEIYYKNENQNENTMINIEITQQIGKSNEVKFYDELNNNKEIEEVGLNNFILEQSPNYQNKYLENNFTEQIISGKQIFINVDDELNILKMNNRIFAKQNLALNKAIDREEFMNMLGRIYLDAGQSDAEAFKVVVFMDNMLDRDQGYKVICAATQFNQILGIDITYILLSSTEDTETLSKYEQLNVKSFISKPITPQKLKDCLKKLNI